MTVFISHSFEDKSEFENVTDWLDQVNVPHWAPSEVKSGASLREQLRVAVNRCNVCIFVATHRSVKSSWCGAELGAFWGAEIPIMVYLADASLPKDALPPIVQGDVWERRLSHVAARAEELSKNASASGRGGSLPPTARVSSITVEELERLVAGAVSLVQARKPSDSTGEGRDAQFESITLESASLVLRGAEATSSLDANSTESWRKQILWVDDRPDNNRYERSAFESFGLKFTLALSTDEAVGILKDQKFTAIISDMGRREGPREGYKLLEAVRSSGDLTPFFIYAGSRGPEHRKEAAERGAQGTTNMASELIDMVVATLPSGSSHLPTR